MTSNFDQIFATILKHEGTQYTDYAQDKGGSTRYGVTLALLQAYQPGATKQDVAEMSQETAKEIY